MKLIDLTGQKFGRWTVQHRAENTSRGLAAWACTCSCGTEKVISGRVLRNGASKSCGCLRQEVPHSVKHGGTGTRLYQIWQGMKRRCYAESHEAFPRYGGRGIKVCREWRDSFESFREWAMSSGYLPHLTLDRENNDLGYTPDNCRWATYQQQNRNRRNNRLVSHRGITKTVKEWSESTGIPTPTLLWRLDAGWTVERTLTQPSK